MRPKLKATLKPWMRDADVIRIGFDREVFELEDADGQIERFLSILDGTLSVEEIAAHSGLTLDEVQEALVTFDDLGFLVDAQVPAGSLTARDLERYRANGNFFANFATLQHSPWIYQQRLKGSTVAVLGLGGASLVAAGLVGLGVGKIIGLDYDQVELSNLNRQYIYRETDLGKLKTEATAEQLRNLNPDVEIVTYNLKVTAKADLLEILQEADLVINGIDTPAVMAARWVNAACVQLQKPMLQCGIFHNRVQLYRFLPHAHGCFDCMLLHALQTDPDSELMVRVMNGQVFQNRNTAMAPHVSVLSGFITSEVSKELAGYAPPLLPSTALEMDMLALQMRITEPFPRSAECPTCGEHRQGEHREPCDLEELIEVAKKQVMQP